METRERERERRPDSTFVCPCRRIFLSKRCQGAGSAQQAHWHENEIRTRMFGSLYNLLTSERGSVEEGSRSFWDGNRKRGAQRGLVPTCCEQQVVLQERTRKKLMNKACSKTKQNKTKTRIATNILPWLEIVPLLTFYLQQGLKIKPLSSRFSFFAVSFFFETANCVMHQSIFKYLREK